MNQLPRIVLTGIGLTCPLGNDLPTYREALLAGKSGVSLFPVRNMGEQPAGVCDFDQKKYQKRKEIRVGTRAGSIAIYCANEAIAHANLDLENVDPSRIGIYLGITVITMKISNIGLTTTILAQLPTTLLGRLRSTLV